MGLSELEKHWEELLAGEGMPADVDQIGKWAEIHNGRRVPVVRFDDAMTSKLPAWPGQSDAADLAACPDPTAEAAEASLDKTSPQD